ncbi:MAG: hypothetical protein II968_03260 [Selenomonadaceae bacterium]|nr:hypothetical protein [Selenomonadaceae bacterium]MBQ6757646.1 hypothetical protein [Selenomonadaceae bacterium]
MILLPITVAVLANVLYHMASKSIPAEQNAFMGLVVNYATALLASAILFFMTPHEKILVEAARSNWACVLMGLAITGVEVSFVMIYRAGGELSTASLIVNILLALAMLIVGGFFYHELITPQKIFGAALCIAGVVMLSF